MLTFRQLFLFLSKGYYKLKNNREELLKNIIDSITIISGNAQLAKEVGHIKWAQDYLDRIIIECNKITSMVNHNKN